MPLPPRKIGGVDTSAMGYGAMGIGNLAYGASLDGYRRCTS
jgi:hypothetical protein